MQLDRIEGKPDEKVAWGSDIAAQMLRRLGVPYVSLNPGASYRGLHDSLVNHLGNERPGILLCLHEDHSVAIAHGYAKATGEPMACVLHSNVGLLHGMMSLFNAWCDRVPMIVLGATGPLDADKRRPWIDWIHTSRDQGAYIRSIIKWDDQPSSPQALVESMCRANIATRTAPTAPVYICLDAGFQEQRLDKEPEWPEISRFVPPEPSRPGKSAVEKAAALLERAERPVIMFGRGSRGQELWQSRIRLAERLGACVVTDLKQGAMFPTDHPAHYLPPFNVLPKPRARAVVRGRRHSGAGLGRPRRRAAAGEGGGQGLRQDRRRDARPEPAHRRQHGIPGAAGAGRVDGDHRRHGGRGFAGGVGDGRPQGAVEAAPAVEAQGDRRASASPWSRSRRPCARNSTIPRT